jgi:hypothetical protein
MCVSHIRLLSSPVLTDVFSVKLPSVLPARQCDESTESAGVKFCRTSLEVASVPSSPQTNPSMNPDSQAHTHSRDLITHGHDGQKSSAIMDRLSPLDA